MIDIVLDPQVPKPRPFRNLGSSVGTYQYHCKLPSSFLPWNPYHNTFQIYNYWSNNTAFQVGGEHLSLVLSFPLRYGLTPRIFIDSPEFGPGSIIGPSNASVTPTPPPSKSSSVNAGAIAGGVVGFIVVVLIVLVAIFYLRRRSWARAAASADVGASQQQQPESDEVAPLSMSEPPRIYVRAFVSRIALVCPHVLLSLTVQGPG